jgi:hypothetical protein
MVTPCPAVPRASFWVSASFWVWTAWLGDRERMGRTSAPTTSSVPRQAEESCACDSPGPGMRKDGMSAHGQVALRGRLRSPTVALDRGNRPSLQHEFSDLFGRGRVPRATQQHLPRERWQSTPMLTRENMPLLQRSNRTEDHDW